MAESIAPGRRLKAWVPPFDPIPPEVLIRLQQAMRRHAPHRYRRLPFLQLIQKLNPRSELHRRVLGAMDLSFVWTPHTLIEKLIKTRQRTIQRIKTVASLRAKEIVAAISRGQMKLPQLASAINELRPFSLYGLPVQQEIRALEATACPSPTTNMISGTGAIKAYSIRRHKLTRIIAAETVKKSNFIIDRRLAEYRVFLGPNFFRRLKQLRSSDHWIDIGAGAANAMNDYFHYARRSALPLPHMTAITVRAVPITRRKIFKSRRFQYLVGRRFEEYADGETCRADLITDLFGATSYSHKFDVVVKRMAKSLKPNGVAYFNMKVAKLILKDPRGRRLKVEDWLRKIRGIKVIEARRSYHFLENNQVRIAFQRTAGPIEVPCLKLVKMEHNDSSPAPRRTYLMTG